MTFHEWLCEVLHCHKHHHSPVKRDEELSADVREASHNVANSAARIQGLASVIQKETSLIERFAREIRK